MKKKSLAGVMLGIGVLMAVGAEAGNPAHDNDNATMHREMNSRNIEENMNAFLYHTPSLHCAHNARVITVLCEIVTKNPSLDVSCGHIRSMLKGNCREL
jgi:hypothetical protein